MFKGLSVQTIHKCVQVCFYMYIRYKKEQELGLCKKEKTNKILKNKNQRVLLKRKATKEKKRKKIAPPDGIYILCSEV